jgi:hypothetical protein
MSENLMFLIHWYAFLGWMIISGIIAVLWLITGKLGFELWTRFKRVYHLSVIIYWLDRLEQEGTHCFQKANDND